MTGRAPAVVAVSLSIALAASVRGQAIAPLVTKKTIPQATIDLIDPESGTSAGSGATGSRLAVGDVILFRSSLTPVATASYHGLQGYVTEYIPANTEVVGVRIIDADGNTLQPDYPGLAVDGCIGGSRCNSFTALACSTGTCSFQTGSIAQLHADTGIFFSNDTRLTRTPGDAFITMNNGTTMSPSPSAISPSIVSLLGDTSGPYYAHNDWDWAQVRAYGTSTAAANTGGDGNTPHRYGSPVAGPETHYSYEATDVGGGAIQFNDAVGPWSRIRYPGSTIGAGVGNIGSSSNLTRALVETTAGTDVTPATPAAARAVRIALGQLRSGEPRSVELALRVTGLPLDSGLAANAACVEAFGSDISSQGGISGGRDNPWPTYVGSPACTDLRLLFDLDVDRDVASGGNLQYSLQGRNLAVTPETNVVVRFKYDPSRNAFVTSSLTPASVGTCTDDAARQCVQWNLGTLQPSAAYAIAATFTAGGAGGTTNVVEANYRSDQVPSPGSSTQAGTVVAPVAIPKITLAPASDPTATFAAAGGTAAMTGTVLNAGTATWTQSSITLVLPTGWSIDGVVTLGGTTLSCSSGCGTARPVYTASFSYNPNESRALAFNALVPAGTANGLYRIDVQTWGSTAVAGASETYFPRAAYVPVGAVRTQRPAVTCPIRNGSPSVRGTSEANAAVAVRFNGIDRGTATAGGDGAWTSTDFTAFGALYGGLEVTTVATASGKLESEPSLACFVTNFDCARAPVASNSGPYCGGGTIELTAAGVTGATYSWTGPNGFTSSEQNPVITGAAAVHGGTYTVAMTFADCPPQTATTDVVVTQLDTPAASNTGPYCEGGTIVLSTPAVANATYHWTSSIGFESFERTPSIPGVTVDYAGTYSVTVSVDGCTSAAGETVVVINALPATPGEFTSASSSVMAGQSGVPYAVPAVADVVYQWSYSGTGVTISGSGASVTLAFANTATSGTLSVIAANDCGSSAARTIAITVNGAIPATPSNFSATATGPSQARLSWTAVAGATSYEILRAQGGSALAPLTTTADTWYDDGNLAVDTTYLYGVRALGPNGPSATALDAATTITFTDDPLAAGTIVRAIHVRQLRSGVNAMRAAAGLTAQTFTDSELPGVVIRATHLLQLRTALDEARSALGLPAIAYTDPVIETGSVVVKAAHWQELREGVR